jgi:hypothetical protein
LFQPTVAEKFGRQEKIFLNGDKDADMHLFLCRRKKPDWAGSPFNNLIGPASASPGQRNQQKDKYSGANYPNPWGSIPGITLGVDINIYFFCSGILGQCHYCAEQGSGKQE